jgi:hypothetical protein
VTLKESQFKEPAAQEKVVLNQAKLADLRKSHFQIGNEVEPIFTRNQQFYTDKTPDMPAMRKTTKNMRESHFALGDNTREFVSQQMMQYRNPNI